MSGRDQASETRLRDDPSAGPALMAAAGIMILSVMDALMKDATGRFSIVQILFLRFTLGSVFASLAFAHSRDVWPHAGSLRANFLRAVAGLVCGLTFVYAIATLPLAKAVALAYAAPLFMVLFGWLVLGEHISRSILAALTIGLAGILVILSGELFSAGYSSSTLGVFSAIASAATYAISMIVVRQRTAHDSIQTIVMLQNVFCALLLLPFVALAWRKPDVAAFALFTVIGFCGVIGHFFLTYGYARASASRLAPLEYTGLLWATLFSIVFFGDSLTFRTVTGGVLIALSGIIIARTKFQRAE